MTLEFLSDAPVGDAELVINLDLEGLGALIQRLHEAVEARRDQLTLEGEESAAAPAEASNAFARVTVRFVPPMRRHRAGATTH